ncbi:glycosyl hydrolase-related protein [Roseibium salinum]|nr:glycosyl hydrolase-related protein [Roseibium salinum]
MWETHGRQSESVLRLPSGFERAEETDLLERSPVALSVTDGRLPLTFKPFEIRTIRIGA